MRTKLFLLIFVILLSALAYFGYPIIRNRYFNNGPRTIQNENNQPVANPDIVKLENSTPENTPTKESETLKIKVDPKDCDNECSDFKKEEELRYCQEVCGLSLDQSSDNCNDKINLEKDYCFKNLAIEKKEFKICDQITDSGVKKSCKNRVTEDIIENQ